MYTPVVYVSGEPVTVPGAVRYVRLDAASLSGGTTYWVSGADCTSLTAIGGADL